MGRGGLTSRSPRGFSMRWTPSHVLLFHLLVIVFPDLARIPNVTIML